MRSPRRKAPSVPASLQRSASASNRRFSLPENWRRLAIATTSGSRRAAASKAGSPVARRVPSATASEEEEPNDPFIEDFSNEVMCMSYLYSKLPETGVSPHIGTGGGALRQGANFQDVWENLLKGNPLVCGEPRQRVEESHPHMEVFLATGERLVFDIERHEFSLEGM